MTTRRMFVTGSMALLFFAQSALAAKSVKKRGKRRPGKRADPEPPITDPKAFLTRVYERAKKDVDGRVVTLSLIKEDRPRQFSAALVALWAKVDARPKNGDEDIGPLDFDPVTNSQGLTVKSFTIANEKQDETSMTLAVTISSSEARNSPEENIIRYDFVREDNLWKINDIRATMDGKPWSLAQLLARGAKS